MKIASVTVEVASEEQLDALLVFVRGGMKAAPAGQEAEPAPAPLEGRRRRGGLASEGTENASPPSSTPSPSAPTPVQTTEEQPASRRRRSYTSAPATPAAEAAPASAPATVGRRARRPSAPAQAPQPEPSDEKIADEDLTKAASAAGRLIPPREIMSFLTNEFGVSELGKLPPERRASFLAGLKELVADADKAG